MAIYLSDRCRGKIKVQASSGWAAHIPCSDAHTCTFCLKAACSLCCAACSTSPACPAAATAAALLASSCAVSRDISTSASSRCCLQHSSTLLSQQHSHHVHLLAVLRWCYQVNIPCLFMHTAHLWCAADYKTSMFAMLERSCLLPQSQVKIIIYSPCCSDLCLCQHQVLLKLQQPLLSIIASCHEA